MKAEEYHSILKQLPIENPTEQDMAMLCPHLAPEEIAEILRTTDSIYIACPPLRIRNGFQVISYRAKYTEEKKGWQTIDNKRVSIVTGTEDHPAEVDWSYAERTLESYADGKSHGSALCPYKHMEKAMEFAEINWGEALTLNDWVSVVKFIIQDPTDLTSHNYPSTKAVIFVTLNRDLNDIINDSSKPESKLFEDAISQITLDKFIWEELNGGRGGYAEFNCANCGAGLSVSECKGCGYSFRDDHFRTGWRTPLPQKIVDFLRQHGHKFKIDPKIAQEKEEREWQWRQRT